MVFEAVVCKISERVGIRKMGQNSQRWSIHWGTGRIYDTQKITVALYIIRKKPHKKVQQP